MSKTNQISYSFSLVIVFLVHFYTLVYSNAFAIREEYNSTRHQSHQSSLTLLQNKLYLPNTDCKAQGGYNNTFDPNVGTLLFFKNLPRIVTELKTYKPTIQEPEPGSAVPVYHDVKYVEETVNIAGKELNRVQVVFIEFTYVKGHTTKPSMSVKKGIGTAPNYPNHRYDAGHIIPAIMGGSNTDLSNFFPQHPGLNRGEWKTREGYINKYLKENPDAIIYQDINFEYVPHRYAPIGYVVNTRLKNPDPKFNIQNGYYDNPHPFDEAYQCPAYQLIDL